MADATPGQASSRRDALKKLAFGGASAGAVTAFPILGQPAVTPGMSRAAHHHPAGAEITPDANWKPLFFDAHQNETVEVLSELIIPATDTPGAKAALVNRFIDLLLSDDDAERKKVFCRAYPGSTDELSISTENLS